MLNKYYFLLLCFLFSYQFCPTRFNKCRSPADDQFLLQALYLGILNKHIFSLVFFSWRMAFLCPLKSQRTLKREQISNEVMWMPSLFHSRFSGLKAVWEQIGEASKRFNTSGKEVWLLNAWRVFLMANGWRGKQAKRLQQRMHLFG